jgi:hypothetical protein
VIAGERLASGSNDRTIKIWDTHNGQCITTLRGHSGIVSSLSLTREGWLVSGSEDTTVKVWNTARPTYDCITTMRGHTGDVNCVAALPGPPRSAPPPLCRDVRALPSHLLSPLRFVCVCCVQTAASPVAPTIKPSKSGRWRACSKPLSKSRRRCCVSLWYALLSVCSALQVTHFSPLPACLIRCCHMTSQPAKACACKRP